MNSKKTNIFKNVLFMDIQNASQRHSPNWKSNSYNCNIIFSFTVSGQICKSKNFRTKNGKARLYSYINWSWYNSKARNELDGACDLPLVVW